MALSYLRDAFGPSMPAELTRFPGVTDKQLAFVDTMLTRGLHTVPTSSCGRLFDAVAALLGLATEVTFEGQAAIALETIATAATRTTPSLEAPPYPFAISEPDPTNAPSPLQLDLRPAILAIAHDLSARVPAGHISARFHNALAAAVAELCARIGGTTGLNRVCLSGGTFQNLFLLERTMVQLRRRGFTVFQHAQVPANDGGLALGQAVIANELLRRDPQP
jgi:hydrogenase maturation protein HypF